MAERRRHPRTQYLCRTEIKWHSEKGEVTVTGMIEDKSVSGLGIQVAKPIPVGTPIQVRYCNRMVTAVVRRAINPGVGVFLGVSFEPDEPDTINERQCESQTVASS